MPMPCSQIFFVHKYFFVFSEYPKSVRVQRVDAFDKSMMQTVGMVETSLRTQRQ